jgi:hypothetical protein
VGKFSDIEEKIIPFFQKYLLQGTKRLDFEDLCKVVKLMKSQTHLTSEGLEQIKKNQNWNEHWKKLESYLNKYPLFSSKYLNYLDWLKILEFQKLGKYDQGFLDKVITIKNNMNNKRTFFVWDHLKGFYNLENKI